METAPTSAALRRPSPLSLMATEIVGGVPATVELLVTEVLFSVAASLPWLS